MSHQTERILCLTAASLSYAAAPPPPYLELNAVFVLL